MKGKRLCPALKPPSRPATDFAQPRSLPLQRERGLGPPSSSSWMVSASARSCGRWASVWRMAAIWCCCLISITAAAAISDNSGTGPGGLGWRAELRKIVIGLDRGRKISHAAVFIEFLSSRPEVDGNRFGATGYCMGGNAVLTAAGAFPERFAAVASFHGGHLGTDQPDSPHLFIKDISGRVYVAGAIEDASFPEEQKNRLEQALADAGVDHLIETYAGAP